MTLEQVDEQYFKLVPTFYVDENDFLREKCPDMDELQRVIENYERVLPSVTEEPKKYEIYGRLGNLYRIQKNILSSLKYLKESYNYYESNSNWERMTIQYIRYGEALKYQYLYTDAIEIFNDALNLCEQYQLHDIEHYAWQHRGKCYMEMGNIPEAERCFIKAFILRKQYGDERLLAGSHKALNFISKVKR